MSRFSNRWIKSYFNFSKKDRNGIIILSVLILLVFIANIIIDYIPGKSDYDYTELEKTIAEWENSETNGSQLKQSLFIFNPNTISPQSLDSLSLPEFVKRNLLSYRNAGGEIKTVAEFRKIYGMTDSIYSIVEEYIQIPGASEYISQSSRSQKAEIKNETIQKGNSKSETDKFSQSSTLVIELNSADSTELVKLNGVGPVFASRIVRFRNLLGGFYTKEQLLEVYNFPEETYERISKNITVNASEIKKIRLNFADFSELLRHPYLNKKQVQSIIDYRTNNGAFKSVEDLVQKNLIDSVSFKRVRPYLNTR